MRVDSHIFENQAQVVGLNTVEGESGSPGIDLVHELTELDLDFDGVKTSEFGRDRHYGQTRLARRYQIGSWAGRIVRNERQVSLATKEDLCEIADGLGISGIITDSNESVVEFMSQTMAVNLVIDGEDIKRYIGPGTKLMIGSPEAGAIIDISEAHLPCKKPALSISRRLELDYEDLKSRFKEVSAEKRGFMAGVYSAGKIALHDQISFQLAIDHRTDIPNWRF